MLPTNRYPKVGQLNIAPDNVNKLELINHVIGGDGLLPQHLYVTSDEEISDGDYVYGWNEIIIWNSQEQHTVSPTGYKKIIATTDRSLGFAPFGGQDILDLPDIPQSFIDTFIEEYNKGNVIDKVLVEYETTTKVNVTNKNIKINQNINTNYMINMIPKINFDNTINISLIEEEKKYR